MDALRTHESYHGILGLIQTSLFQVKEVYVRGFFFYIINDSFSLNLLPTISETKKKQNASKAVYLDSVYFISFNWSCIGYREGKGTTFSVTQPRS